MHILFFLICLVATTVGAASGIGGGVIIKPVLDASTSLGVSAISFMSGCTVLAMSVVSLAKAFKSGVKIELKISTALAIGAAVGGVVGKSIFSAIIAWLKSESTVGAVQSAILIILTALVFLFVKNKQRVKCMQITNLPLCVFIGLSLGLLSAFLGIGGGPINIAVLTYFYTMSSKACSVNSIYIIFFSQITSLVSTFAAGSVPAVSLSLLGVMVLGGVLGGFLGSALLKKLSNNDIDKLFSAVMLFIIAISIFNFIRFVSPNLLIGGAI